MMINLERAKNNQYTIKFDNKYVHSKYNPGRESDVFIDKYSELLTDKVVVVYGLGLGYHINSILKRVSKNTKIVVFEWNVQLFKMCKRLNKSIFSFPNLTIYTKYDDFYENFLFWMKKVNDIIIYKPCLNTIKDSNYKLFNLINNYDNNRSSIKENQKLLSENYIQNLKSTYKRIGYILNKFKTVNKEFLITAAGPSLDNELEVLMKNRNRFVIISVGSALNALMNNNIRPDIIVIIDGKEAVAKQLRGFENEKIPLCFLSTASRWAVKNYNGPKYMFYNSKDEDNIIIETGKTVAVAAMSIAIHCGAKQIVLLGQDLAYLNGKSHTSTYESIYGWEDNPTINKYNKLVKGIDGSMLTTTSGYIYFKEQIERLIDINKDVKFINCSKGAFIEGAQHVEFEKYINNRVDY